MERIGNAFIYPVDLKGQLRAFVQPCVEGYTVYVDINLSHDEQIKAALHEIGHIERNDFEKENVQEIEVEAHGKSEEAALRDVAHPSEL